MLIDFHVHTLTRSGPKEIQIEKSYVEEHVTAILKTGGRYEQLKTLLRTKNQSYPRMHIIIVDDEWNESFEKEIQIYKEATYVAMNESAGISKDKIMMISVEEFYGEGDQYCSTSDEPYKYYRTMQFIRSRIWLQDIEYKRIYDRNACILREDNHFFNLEIFVDYLKNKSVSKENYMKMLFSAQCNIDKSLQEYYRAYDIYRGLIKFLIALTKTNKRNKLTNVAVIEKFKKDLLYREWTSNRFLFEILQCYLGIDDLDKVLISLVNDEPVIEPVVSSLNSPHFSLLKLIKLSSKIYDTTHHFTSFLLIISSLAITLLVMMYIQYKRGMLRRSTLIIMLDRMIRFRGDGISWKIRKKLITVD
ncbi:hypothetical protein RF11_13089 [Thelohanellus kitauei]|uniref:Uncharacterized protein n=1 Tax=Thelohanellus kitauei TaxID=669202 RepID=A0A0C2M027_THEKT|nr:hypothetical protein RF11_13089 [Thelohanellus kitauei]